MQLCLRCSLFLCLQQRLVFLAVDMLLPLIGSLNVDRADFAVNYPVRLLLIISLNELVVIRRLPDNVADSVGACHVRARDELTGELTGTRDNSVVEVRRCVEGEASRNLDKGLLQNTAWCRVLLGFWSV